MRAKRTLSLLVAVVVTATALAAGKTHKRSTVHLRDGQFVSGVITQRNSERVEIISDADSIKYTFATTDIDHISHEAPHKNYDTSKFRGFIDLGYAPGLGTPRNNFWAVETSFGYQITPNYYLGAGIALHNFKACLDSYPYRADKVDKERNDPKWRYPFIPLYIEGRYNVHSESHNTPFVSLKVGATFINHKGFFSSPTIGWHFKARQFFSFNVGVAYSLHVTNYKFWCTGNTPGAINHNSGTCYINKNTAFHNILAKVGVEF